MKEYFKKLPEEIQVLIYLARDVASSSNTPAYLVGGPVRDLLLGFKNLDLDIAIEGEGIKFAEILAHNLKARFVRHKRFGTATVILGPHLKIDITSSRKETYPAPAQLPQVTSGSLEDDLLRRDFTINAMAVSINRGDFGKLIDLFGAKADLKNKKVRILHNLSFIDDPTRILRAVRFEQRYKFRIEPETLKVLKEAVRAKMLDKVSPQRVRDELILSLKEDQPLRQIERMQQLIGLSFIYPALKLSGPNREFLNSIRSQIHWFKEAHPKRRPLDTWLIYFIGLISGLRLSAVRAICAKYAFRRGEEKRIFSFKKIGKKFISELRQKKIKASRIFSLLEPLSYEVIILIKAKYPHPDIQRHIEDFFEIYNGMRIYISGKDLQGLGVKPGPYYRKVFTKVLNAKLNGLVKTREEELALIRNLIGVK